MYIRILNLCTIHIPATNTYTHMYAVMYAQTHKPTYQVRTVYLCVEYVCSNAYVHNYVACSIESSSLFASLYIVMLLMHQASRLTIVGCEAKKKQAVRDKQVSYLQLAPL